MPYTLCYEYHAKYSTGQSNRFWAIRERYSLGINSAFYTVGLDPADAALVLVKSPGHFRVAFGPLARQVLVADTPGAARPNVRALTFKHVTRPLYPLDE
jgi:microcystin degradation protein MlrC